MEPCSHGRSNCRACYMRSYRARPDRGERHRQEVAAYSRLRPEVNLLASRRYYAKKRAAKSPKPSFEDRFWARVDKNGESGCWLWTGSVRTFGYGQVERNGQALRAHRVSWELMIGAPVPPLLMHTCDLPRCVNPAHLRPGTQRDNIHDMITKGRGRNQYSR